MLLTQAGYYLITAHCKSVVDMDGLLCYTSSLRDLRDNKPPSAKLADCLRPYPFHFGGLLIIAETPVQALRVPPSPSKIRLRPNLEGNPTLFYRLRFYRLEGNPTLFFVINKQPFLVRVPFWRGGYIITAVDYVWPWMHPQIRSPWHFKGIESSGGDCCQDLMPRRGSNDKRRWSSWQSWVAMCTPELVVYMCVCMFVCMCVCAWGLLDFTFISCKFLLNIISPLCMLVSRFLLSCIIYEALLGLWSYSVSLLLMPFWPYNPNKADYLWSLFWPYDATKSDYLWCLFGPMSLRSPIIYDAFLALWSYSVSLSMMPFWPHDPTQPHYLWCPFWPVFLTRCFQPVFFNLGFPLWSSVTGPGVLPWRDWSTSPGILRFLACSLKVPKRS